MQLEGPEASTIRILKLYRLWELGTVQAQDGSEPRKPFSISRIKRFIMKRWPGMYLIVSLESLFLVSSKLLVHSFVKSAQLTAFSSVTNNWHLLGTFLTEHIG